MAICCAASVSIRCLISNLRTDDHYDVCYIRVMQLLVFIPQQLSDCRGLQTVQQPLFK